MQAGFSAPQTVWQREGFELSVPFSNMPLRADESAIYPDFMPETSEPENRFAFGERSKQCGFCGWTKGEGLTILEHQNGLVDSGSSPQRDQLVFFSLAVLTTLVSSC
jgi:hypothetical protein